MGNTIFNAGLTLAYPYESKYSIWRRFLSANQRLKVEDICQHFDVPFHDSQDRRRAPNILFPQILHTVFTPQGVPSYLQLFENIECDTDFYHIDRHCPDCSACGFHTDLYRLPWLDECPIHHSGFVTKCPECDKEWPTYELVSKRKCRTCGLIKFVSNAEDHRQLTNEDFSVLHDLMEFVSYKPLKPLCLLSRSEASTRQYTSIGYFHRYFPAVQYARHPEHERDRYKKFLTQNDPKLDVHRTRIINKEDYFTMLAEKIGIKEERGARQVAIKKRVFEKIVDAISAGSNHMHSPKIFNLAELKPEDLIGPTKPCWYCLALSYWLALTKTDSPIDAAKHLSDIYKLANWQPIEFFKTPTYWTSAVSSGVLYKMDEKSSDALYFLELEHLFVSILESLNALEQITSSPRHQLQEVWPKSLSCLSEQLALFFYHEEDELLVSVINQSSLSDEHLYSSPEYSIQCETFEKYLYDKKLYGLVASEIKANEMVRDRVFDGGPNNFFDRRFTMPVLRLSQDS